jgi:hypothetical protein
MILNGCCTYLTVDSATHEYRHDRVVRIENAGVTRNDVLVALVYGARAESSKIGPFTITVSLPSNEDGAWVPQDGMQANWPLLDAGDIPRKIAIGPTVTLPAYQSAIGNQEKFLPIARATEALYLVKHSKPDRGTSFFYVSNRDRGRKIEIEFDGRDVTTPQRYPLLLFVPITAAVDIVTFPFQIYWLSRLGDKPPNVVEMAPPEH